MGQQRVSSIALIHTESAYANFVLENDIERIIDIFGSRSCRDSYFFQFEWIALRAGPDLNYGYSEGYKRKLSERD